MFLTKDEARRYYSAIRKNFSAQSKEIAEKIITEKLINLQLIKNFETVLCYVSVKDEVSTMAIIDYFLRNGKNVFIPYCIGKDMFFYRIRSLDELVDGKFGIPTVDTKKSEKFSEYKMAVSIIPGLSFDLNGNRLGYGAGYYDRFLKNNPDILKIALSFECCIAESIPHSDFDIPVDVIITEQRIIGKL